MGCNNYSGNNFRNVFIQKENGRYCFSRNGKRFIVKGVAGFTHLKELSEHGGNTIRTWDTAHLDEILNEANIYNLAVVVGLFIPDNKGMMLFYDNDKMVQEQLRIYTAFIKKYKSNPAILCWCLGNELNFPNNPKYYSFYKAFNNIVKMIHKEDPDHPVTTTMVNFQKKNIFNIKFRTEIDFISINIFGGLRYLKEDLQEFSWIWNDPFLITEWGIDGPWGTTDQTKWGAYIEQNSSRKAADYIDMFQKYIPQADTRCLGSLAFYWGYKQEYTHTWFSIFDEDDNMSESVVALQSIWENKKSEKPFPSLEKISIDHWLENTDLIFNADSSFSAKAIFKNQSEKNLKIKWEILPEDWFTVNTIYSSKKPDALALIENDTLQQIKFKAPSKEGPYRIFVKAVDNAGHFSTCNLPFYVIENNKH